MLRSVILAVFVLVASSVTWTNGNPVDTTEVTEIEDLPECYLGMHSHTYQCVADNMDDYVYCGTKAERQCTCAEGLRCKRGSYVPEGATEMQCVFVCVIADPLAYGLKNAREWDQNQELLLK